jgi:hypothetical protein
MIDKIQLTLYEIFGYFLPGTIAAGALAILYWALCIPAVAFPVFKIHPDAVGWGALVALSYMLGHIIQGLGGKYLGGIEEKVLGPNGSIPPAIVASAQSLAAQQSGVKSEDLDSKSLFRIADQYSLNGPVGDRDVYIYREGFYRGCTVALALLSIALIARALSGWTQLRFPAYVFFVSSMQLLVSALIAISAARICKKRFERFGEYRVARAVFAFLVFSKQESAPIPKTESTHA